MLPDYEVLEEKALDKANGADNLSLPYAVRSTRAAQAVAYALLATLAYAERKDGDN